ncbi:HNH endonuclease [Acidithiobacillus sp. MC6.1]|nr:HNH endonuclease [Acidithiobacillus sp. MC6.1]
MKKITLTQGLFCTIDDTDEELISDYKWCARRDAGGHAYAVTGTRKACGLWSTIRMHRLIMDPQPGLEVDHIDGNGLNNCRSNLRIASHSENGRNSHLHKDSASGYKGVSWHRKDRAWRARITVNGEHIFLGNYRSQEEAHEAYCVASARFHGEFGRTA